MFLSGIQGFQKRKYQTLKEFKKHFYTSYLEKVTSILKMHYKFQTWILLNTEDLLSALNLQRKRLNTPNISTGSSCKTWRYLTPGVRSPNTNNQFVDLVDSIIVPYHTWLDYWTPIKSKWLSPGKHSKVNYDTRGQGNLDTALLCLWPWTMLFITY